MQVCQHRPFECIQVSCRGIEKCITNFNRLTTVAHVIDALLDNLSEKQYLTINDCCLYVQRAPYVFPLKNTDFIQDIFMRYAPNPVHFKLSFKRVASPSRFAQRKRLLRTPPVSNPTVNVTNAFEQLKIQETLIRRQQEIICELRKSTMQRHSSRSRSRSNYDNYVDWLIQNEDDDEEESDSSSRTYSDVSTISRRQSRQDEYHQAIDRQMEHPARSLSRVRFRPTTIVERQPMEPHCLTSATFRTKSILKNSTTSRPSSVDRDIARLTSLKLHGMNVCNADDVDEDNLSDRSTTDSCLGSLSSDDNISFTHNSHQMETLV